MKEQYETPYGYCTYERCKEEALKYDNKKEFREKSYRCYIVAHKNKWLELCSHMTKNKKATN